MELSELQAAVMPRLQKFLAEGGDAEALAELCGVKTITLKRWKSGRQPPRGEPLVRLWVLLKLAGFDSPEMEQVEPYVRFIAELVTHQLMTVEQATEHFGLSHSQRAYVTFRGGTRPTRLDPEEMARIKSAHTEELSQRSDAARTRLVRGRSSTQSATRAFKPAESPAVRPTPSRVRIGSPTGVPSLALQLASMLRAAQPFAEHLNSDDCTDAQREEFRQHFGSFEEFNDFVLTLSALRSSKARKYVAEGDRATF